MRVLLASHRYFPVPGGTERLVQTVAEGLVARGHRATVVTQREPGVASEETLNGVRVVRIPNSVIGGIRIPRGYLRFLRRSDADVFHLYGNRIWCADAYFPRARGFDWPQVLTGLGFYQYAMHPRVWDRWYFERYFPWAARAFDRYEASTRAEAEMLVRWGVPGERVDLLPLGIDLSEFGSTPDGFDTLRASWGVRAPNVAVYVGGFFENKRVDRLIEAAAQSGGRWALVLVGRDIPDSPCSMDRARALAQERGVEVRFPGVLDRAEVVRALFAADAVVLGSEYEGFGLTLVEAMAAGKPFVSWNAGAAPELAALGGGIVVNSIAEFAHALGRLDDAGERRRIGAAGRAHVEEFSQSRMVERHLALYERLSGERRSDSRLP